MPFVIGVSQLLKYHLSFYIIACIIYSVIKPGNPRRVEKITVLKLIPINMLVLLRSELTRLKPITLSEHLKINLKKLLNLIENICKNKTIQQPTINKIKILFVFIISPSVFNPYKVHVLYIILNNKNICFVKH